MVNSFFFMLNNQQLAAWGSVKQESVRDAGCQLSQCVCVQAEGYAARLHHVTESMNAPERVDLWKKSCDASIS